MTARTKVATGTVAYADLSARLRDLLGVDVCSTEQLTRDIAMVSEGMCPAGHGPLRLRPLRPGGHVEHSAGWCDQCQRGFSARTHYHDEDCAGPNLDEAHLWCCYQQAEPSIVWWDPIAFQPDIYRAVSYATSFTTECRWCGQQNGHAPGCPLGGGGR